MLFNPQPITASQHAHALSLIEALESTKYIQAHGALHRNNGGYCCLGVACDLYRLQTNRGHWKSPGIAAAAHDYILFILTDDMGKEITSLSTMLKDPLSNWFGFDHNIQNLLIGLNDKGAPFIAIAFVLKRWLVGQTVVPDPSPTPLPA